ncbi:hypothetical protein BpHYR1_001113 [Brachionus plicatilis]|uniref:Uncharacterized protein n=1 Tax=Brachionus plicatilis TaxID=10195 RepID=A0A3M7S7D9_BRAPC|nr:hypothetical protein BpHYR1_001113 [Brachionus plicatilis]
MIWSTSDQAHYQSDKDRFTMKAPKLIHIPNENPKKLPNKAPHELVFLNKQPNTKRPRMGDIIAPFRLVEIC